MKKAILISSATAMLMVGGIAIAAPGDRGMRADTNGAGTISSAEMTQSLASRFAKMDVNGAEINVFDLQKLREFGH